MKLKKKGFTLAYKLWGGGDGRRGGKKDVSQWKTLVIGAGDKGCEEWVAFRHFLKMPAGFSNGSEEEVGEKEESMFLSWGTGAMDMPSLALGRMWVEQVRGAEILIDKLLNILVDMVTKQLGT